MNAERLLAHFDRIAEAPDAIPRLRQFILDLAVRGKLVEQDPNDEPAAELLKRVQVEKARLRREGLIAGEKLALTVLPIELPFSIPSSWQWVRFIDYATDISTGPFGSILHQSDYVDRGVPLVNPSHMLNGRIVPEQNVTVSYETAEQLSAYKLLAGDIVMARRGEVGRAAVVYDKEDGWLCGTGSFFLRFAEEICREYLMVLLRCEFVRKYLAGEAIGITMVNLNHGILKRMPLPIPPLAEQHRIVAKVDELMALCDRLEAQLTTTEADSRRLLEAVLHEAWPPPFERNPLNKTTDTNLWGIHAGKTGNSDSLFLKKNCMAVGWTKMGNLSAVKPGRDAFKARVAEIYPDAKPGAIPNNAGQLFRIVHEMKRGDLVVYPLQARPADSSGPGGGRLPLRPQQRTGLPACVGSKMAACRAGYPVQPEGAL